MYELPSIRVYRNTPSTFVFTGKRLRFQAFPFPIDISCTINTNSVGVNGTDSTLTLNTDAWFYLHAVTDGTNSGAEISPSPDSPILKGGMTNSLFIGPVQFNTAGYGWIEQIQNNNRINMQDRGVLPGGVSATAPNTYQPLFMPQAIPICATAISGYMAGARGKDAEMAISATGTDMGRLPHNGTGFPDWDGYGVSNCFTNLELVTPQTIYWKSVDTMPRNNLYISGYLI